MAIPLCFDLAGDAEDGAPLHHLVMEGLAVVTATAGAAYGARRLIVEWTAARDRQARAEADAARARADEGAARLGEAQARDEARRSAADAADAREQALSSASEAEAARQAANALTLELAEAERRRVEAENYRESTRAPNTAIAAAIAEQLRTWGLSAAEMEVARLLLLGLSHREIGQIRGTTEHTARDQAQGVYKKAGVAGRAELSAFFLEDLLPVVSRG